MFSKAIYALALAALFGLAQGHHEGGDGNAFDDAASVLDNFFG